MTPCDAVRVSQAKLDRSKLWTEADYLALDRTTNRIELMDGRLQVSPGPAWEHQEISSQLAAAIRPAALDVKLRVAGGVNVRLATDRLVIPDLAVADVDTHLIGAVADAAQVVLVGEIASRTRRMRLYEAAGIGWYLVVEPDMQEYRSVRLRLFRLRGDRYELHASADHGETLIADGPFPIAIRTEDLTQP